MTSPRRHPPSIAAPALALLLALLLALGVVAPMAGQAPGAPPPTVEALLERALEHHDPRGRLLAGPVRLHLEETRPDGPGRTSRTAFDGPGRTFHLTQELGDGAGDGATVEGVWDGASETCRWRSEGLPEEDLERLTCERLLFWRDYYGFLWGLPMKLRDPGVRLADRVRPDDFQGQPVWALGVEFDPEVGTDHWEVYFDRETARPVGYRFWRQDPGPDRRYRDGEYLVLAGELTATVDGATLRLPGSIAWYTHAASERHGADQHLGTDHLRAVEAWDGELPAWAFEERNP